MTANPPTPQEREAFYRAAILGLCALDAREPKPRRFGSEADARWAQFSGALGFGDRIDMLVRDAVGTWGTAFSPSDCFGFFGLADDEPFGPDWVTVHDTVAKNMVAECGGRTHVEDIAAVLGVKATTVHVPPLTPATKLVVAGGAALLAVATAVSANDTLSWTDQVVAVAERPVFRQLAGLLAIVVGARGRTVVIRPGGDSVGALKAAGFAHIDVAVVSADAEPEAAELARSAAGR